MRKLLRELLHPLVSFSPHTSRLAENGKDSVMANETINLRAIKLLGLNNSDEVVLFHAAHWLKVAYFKFYIYKKKMFYLKFICHLLTHVFTSLVFSYAVSMPAFLNINTI